MTIVRLELLGVHAMEGTDWGAGPLRDPWGTGFSDGSMAGQSWPRGWSILVHVVDLLKGLQFLGPFFDYSNENMSDWSQSVVESARTNLNYGLKPTSINWTE